MDENAKKLDSCDNHDFQPIIKDDGSSSLYKCVNCGGIVTAKAGVKYTLTGRLR
jgi:uncharacterized Zn finger protein